MTSVSGYAKILVTIQRNGRPDDLLSIAPDLESDGYYVTFRQRTVGSTASHYCENGALVSYLRHFFAALQYDHDRPHFVQLDIPMYPTVLLTLGNLLGYEQHVLGPQIESLQEDWPFESFKETV